MPHVVSIAYRPADIEQRPPDRYGRVAAERATLIEERGIDGDTKSRGGKRQLNVMRAETVEGLRADGFRTEPGELGEQLVIAGLEEDALTTGARLRLGDTVVLEITEPRTPCGRFAHIQGKTIKEAWGRIGAMARVVCGGEVAVGAEVRREEAAEALSCPPSPS